MWVATLLVVPSLFSSLALSPPARAADGLWTQIPPPAYRYAATSVYDRARHRMILFGGANFTQTGLNDVWVLELAYPNRWRLLTPTGTPPSPRRGHSAVYDPVGDRMLVFGGGFWDGAAWHLNNEVWALSLGGTPHWSLISPSGTPPAPRFATSMVFDAFRNRMLVQGGALNATSFVGDTWALSFNGTPAWTLLAGNSPVGERVYACAIVDSLRDRMVIMGGLVASGAAANSVSDTWTVPLTNVTGWTELTTIGSPPSTFAHSAAYDPLHDQMIVFSGFDTNTQQYQLGAWRLRFSTATPTWTRGPLSGPVPPATTLSTAIYDPQADALRTFGGIGSGPASLSQDVGTLWLHPSPWWGEPLASQAPPPVGRRGATVAYDSQNHRMILFGGIPPYDGAADLNDVWTLDLTTPTPVWTSMSPAGVPPSGRSFASMVYDPSGNRMILYGGEDSQDSRFPDVWSLTLTGTPAWSELTPSGTPPPGRSRHGAIYDPIRDRMVTFGGASLVFPYFQNDAWALSLSGAPAWSPLTPSGTPPHRRKGLSVVLDSARDRMLMFGGNSDQSPVLNSDVWALSLSGGTAWDSLEVAFGPIGRRQQVAAYDPSRDRLLVFGGHLDPSGNALPTNDLWSLSLAGSPAWTELHPPGTPEPDAESAAIFDIAGDRLIKYGGLGGNTATWIYQPGAVLDVPLSQFLPASSSSIVATPNPSRGAIELSFVMPVAGRAQLRVFDVSGRQVAPVVDATLPAGRQVARWDGTSAGRKVATGVYLARLETPGGVATTRLLLIR